VCNAVMEDSPTFKDSHFKDKLSWFKPSSVLLFLSFIFRSWFHLGSVLI
jgi:hypothetical protein